MAQQWGKDPHPSRGARHRHAQRTGGRAAPQPANPAGGLDPKVGGLLAYLVLGWVGGVVMLVAHRHPEVRFHGAQSVLASLAFVTVSVAIGLTVSALAMIPGVSIVGAALLSLLYPLLSLGGMALWVHLCVKGYHLEHYKLPVVGDIAERWAGS